MNSNPFAFPMDEEMSHLVEEYILAIETENFKDILRNDDQLLNVGNRFRVWALHQLTPDGIVRLRSALGIPFVTRTGANNTIIYVGRNKQMQLIQMAWCLHSEDLIGIPASYGMKMVFKKARNA